MTKSKARKARDAETFKARMVDLLRMRGDGLSCSTCKHFAKRVGDGYLCELDSDFYGDTIVPPTYLCTNYGAKP